MRMNFKVSFYLRSNYENKEGKSPVMLRVFLNGEMANFGSTKIFVDKTLWNNTGSRLKGRTSEALSVNAALDSISTTLNSIFHKFENDETLSLDKIRSYFLGKDREYTTFLPVFDKFNDKTYRDGKLFPVLSNQKTNSYLKEIADLCGIKKNLTFHMARHTFATMSLSKGVPMESVSKMLGHTNIKTTQIYARITNKKIEHDMEQLADKLGKFNTAMGV